MIITYVIIIVIMVALSALFSSTEIAFYSANRMRLKKSAEGGSRTAALALKIMDKFTGALSAILVGNNFVNIAASTFATILIMTLFVKLGGNEDSGWISVISTTVMTLIVLIFGEIVPKTVGKQNSDAIAKAASYPVRILTVILYPLTGIVTLLVAVFRKIWGKDREEDDPTVTEEELSSIIETVEEEGVIDEEQSELLQSTLEFPDTTVGELLTPRIDLTVIDIDDKDEALKIIEDSRFTRIPVYEDSIDNIIGILSLTKYYKAISVNDEEGETDDIDLRELLMPPLFLHKTMKLPVALGKMRAEKTHIAIIIDEFGGTMGIVTMEDILEELVGDIWDENDVIVDEVSQIGDNMYDVNGDTNIDDFFAEIEFNDSSFESEYTTVGGWAVEMLEANPHVGDSFTYKNLYIIVTEMDDMRVTKLSAVVTPSDEEEKE